MKFELSKVIGHRGACGHAPENTLSSMTKAYDLGAKWVEFDVMLAKTGEPIIIHDFTLDRTTNGKGHVRETDYESLAALECGSWFSKDFTGEKIPALQDLLTHVSRLDLGINVEIKPNPGEEESTTQKTLAYLKTHWPDSCHIPLISSFSTKVLKTVYESGISCKLGLIIDNWESDWVEVIHEYNCFSLHVDHTILTQALVHKIKGLNRVVLAFTVNEVERAKELFAWGVDSVFTDYPDLILSAT